MKAVAILLLAVVAMASAQGVNVVGNNPGPGQVKIVEQPGGAAKVVGPQYQGQIVDPGFYRPSASGGSGGGVGQIVDPGFYRPSASGGSGGGVGQIVDPGFYRPSASGGSGGGVDESPPSTTITNPDPGFYLPGTNNVVQPSIDPTFVVDPAFYRPSDPNAQPSLDPTFVDPGFYQPSDPNAQPSIDAFIVDPAFYRPSDPQAPNIDQTIVVDQAFYRPGSQQQNRPQKQYNDPKLRGGK